MAEIYGIQAVGQSSNAVARGNPELANYTTQFLNKAAADMDKLGNLMNDRAHRASVGKMDAAAQEAADFINNFSDFDGEGDYRQRMLDGAMSMYDSAYNSMSRDEQIMFDRNNPSARDIFRLSSIKSATKKSLEHEANERKQYHNQIGNAILINKDENTGALSYRSVADAKFMLNSEFDTLRTDPALADNPDTERELEFDLGRKVVGGMLDGAIAEGRTADVYKILGDEQLRSFVTPEEVASALKAARNVETAKSGTDGNAVKAGAQFFDELFDAMVHNAQANGGDDLNMQAIQDDYFRFVTAIKDMRDISDIKDFQFNMMLAGTPGFDEAGRLLNEEFYKFLEENIGTPSVLQEAAHKAISKRKEDPTVYARGSKAISMARRTLDKFVKAQDVSKYSDLNIDKLTANDIDLLKVASKDLGMFGEGLSASDLELKKNIDSILDSRRLKERAMLGVGTLGRQQGAVERNWGITGMFAKDRGFYSEATMSPASAYQTAVLDDYYKDYDFINMVNLPNSVRTVADYDGEKRGMAPGGVRYMIENGRLDISPSSSYTDTYIAEIQAKNFDAFLGEGEKVPKTDSYQWAIMLAVGTLMKQDRDATSFGKRYDNGIGSGIIGNADKAIDVYYTLMDNYKNMGIPKDEKISKVRSNEDIKNSSYYEIAQRAANMARVKLDDRALADFAWYLNDSQNWWNNHRVFRSGRSRYTEQGKSQLLNNLFD